MNEKKYEFTHTEIHFATNPAFHDGKAFVLNWVCKGMGFGQLSFYCDPNFGNFICDTETMSEEFIKQAFAYHLSNNTTFNHV